MGIRGLQTFIERDCPDACKYVSIKHLADDHRYKFQCDPVLAMDGMCLINRIYRNSNMEWIYGGQWMQFVKSLESFISSFRSIGVRIVFFFDGTVCDAKREEWIKRRIKKYPEIESIFNELKLTGREPDRNVLQMPTSIGSLSRFAVKELGAEVHQTDREADDAIAEYALKNKNVFAILSQDSDFIIYDTKSYLSISHLNLNTLETIHYDRNRFAAHYLQMHVKQLPLFACLAGNDIVPHEKLTRFHNRLTNNGRVYLGAIAHNLSNVISSCNWTGDFNNKAEMEHISSMVFGNKSHCDMIRDGLKSYAMGYCVASSKVNVQVSPHFERTLYERHLNCTNMPVIYNIMCNLEYESSEVLEDDVQLPSALVFREIRQRCYGVLFNCFLKPSSQASTRLTKSGNPIRIKEWCAYKGNFMNHPELVDPLPLQTSYSSHTYAISPSIEDVWFKLSVTEKMKLFWSILQIPMEFELLVSLPKHFVTLACVLSYLIGGTKSGPLVKPWEVAAVVAQAVCMKSAEDLEQLAPPPVQTTAVNLSTLFMRGVSMITMALSTCDFPFPLEYAMPWKYFDGKLFHHFYTKIQKRPTLSVLCDNNPGAVEKFRSLLSAVTSNTCYAIDRMDWNSIMQGFV